MTRKLWLGRFAAVAVFGMMATWYASGAEDPFLNGAWRHVGSNVTTYFNNGNWGPPIGHTGDDYVRGTYTANNGIGTFRVTYIHSNMLRSTFGISLAPGWYSRSQLIAALPSIPPGFPIDDLFAVMPLRYTITGNNLTLTLSGVLARFFSGEWRRM